MPTPSISKTWNWTSNQRSLFVSVAQSAKDIMYGWKVGVLAMAGATVKGSSVGVTTTMDAVDRWTSAAALGGRVGTRTTTGATWFVFTLANIGGDLLFAFIDSGGSNNQMFMGYSPGGNYTVSTTQTPTATDEVAWVSGGAVGSNFQSATGTWDRIWSIGTASDGTAIRMISARAGQFEVYAALEKVTSAVVSPATFSPEVVFYSCTPGTALTNSTANFLGMAGNGSWSGNARAFNGTTNAVVVLFGGCEGYGNSSSASARETFIPELQGALHLQELSFWTETGTTRGKLGNAIDLWSGTATMPNGATYPNDNTRTFIAVGSIVIPWDGSIPVMV